MFSAVFPEFGAVLSNRKSKNANPSIKQNLPSLLYMQFRARRETQKERKKNKRTKKKKTKNGRRNKKNSEKPHARRKGQKR